jgi:eukaryotic-like serine/threonine-protein kinase
VARKRQTDPAALARQLRGELDSIALKALEKERSRRYPSVSELGADINRYLNNETVLAVAPSLVYRARKFARRYRVALIPDDLRYNPVRPPELGEHVASVNRITWH